MRKYGRVSTSIFTDATPAKWDDVTFRVAIYLLAGPHTNLVGCFRLPTGYLCEDLEKDSRTVQNAISRLEQDNWLAYCPDTKWIWVRKFLVHNPFENAGVARAALAIVKQVPNDVSFIMDFLESTATYGKWKWKDVDYGEEFAKYSDGVGEGLGGGSRSIPPHARPRWNLKPEPEPEPGEGATPPPARARRTGESGSNGSRRISEDQPGNAETEPGPAGDEDPDPARTVFETWQRVCNHPHAQLDDKRRRIIEHWLDVGYPVDQLCAAVEGCAQTPHNTGHNDKGTKYDSIGLIFGDADRIDQFIRNAHEPPRPPTGNHRDMEDHNQRTGDEWATQQGGDDRIIEGEFTHGSQ